MMALAAGKLEKPPFEESVIAEMRSFIADQAGVPEAERGVADGQSFHLGILSKLLQVLKDPDWRCVGEAAAGVPLGVDVEMPRTPAVFEAKTKWELADDGLHPEREVPNYGSVQGFEEQVECLFQAEAKMG